MAPIAVHEVTTFYNMYNQQPVGKYKLNVCTNLPCQLRDGQTRARAPGAKARHQPWARPRPTACSPLQQSECLGACADSPVLLVNDRTMCSFMSNDKLDQLVDGAQGACRQGKPAESMLDLSQFQATGCRPASTAATSVRRSTPA